MGAERNGIPECERSVALALYRLMPALLHRLNNSLAALGVACMAERPGPDDFQCTERELGRCRGLSAALLPLVIPPPDEARQTLSAVFEALNHLLQPTAERRRVLLDLDASAAARASVPVAVQAFFLVLAEAWMEECSARRPIPRARMLIRARLVPGSLRLTLISTRSGDTPAASEALEFLRAGADGHGWRLRTHAQAGARCACLELGAREPPEGETPRPYARHHRVLLIHRDPDERGLGRSMLEDRRVRIFERADGAGGGAYDLVLLEEALEREDPALVPGLTRRHAPAQVHLVPPWPRPERLQALLRAPR